MENTLQPDTQSLKAYWIFFAGQLVSLFGSSVVQFAIIWWLTVTSQNDPRYADRAGTILGVAFVAGFAPFVITSLFAGVLVDRWNRKIIIAMADTAQALFTFILILLFYFNQAQLPFVLMILATRAIAQGFHSPATQAIIPIMVPKEKLTKVNSFQNLFSSSVNLVGPIIGAVLIEALGVKKMATILWIDLLTFLVAVVPLIFIHIPDITKEKRMNQNGNSFKADLGEGISFIKNQEGLLSLLVTFTVINIVTAPVNVLIPLIIIDPDLMAGNAATLAIFMAVLQIGQILASLLLTKTMIASNNAKGVLIGQAIIYFSLLVIILSVILSNLWLLYIGAFISGASIPLANVPSQTIWQFVVPPKLQGRVMSVRMVIAWTMIPVAQLLGGALSDLIGPINVFTSGLIIGIVFLAYAWLMTGFPQVEQTLGINTNMGDTTIQSNFDRSRKKYQNQLFREIRDKDKV